MTIIEIMMYAFSLTKSLALVLAKLKASDHLDVIDANTIDHYISLLLQDQPTYILGIGSCNGKDSDNVRIETITTNQFRNRPIDPSLPKKQSLSMNYFLQPTLDKTKLAFASGNSWFNLISWRIMQQIKSNQLKSHYTFLHILKSFSSAQTTSIINKLLEQVKIKSGM